MVSRRSTLWAQSWAPVACVVRASCLMQQYKQKMTASHGATGVVRLNSALGF